MELPDNNKSKKSQSELLKGRLTAKKLISWINSEFERFAITEYKVIDILTTKFSSDQYEGGACKLHIFFIDTSLSENHLLHKRYFLSFYYLKELEWYLKNGYELYLRFDRNFILSYTELDVRKIGSQPYVKVKKEEKTPDKSNNLKDLKLYSYDINRRIYEMNGVKQNSPFEEGYYKPLNVISETEKMYICEYGTINKKTMEYSLGRMKYKVFTEQQKNDNIYLSKRHILSNMVLMCKSVDTLRRIEAILNEYNKNNK